MNSLETQLIRASLFTRTDEEISSLIDVPVGEVSEYISKLMGSDIELRETSLKQIKEDAVTKQNALDAQRNKQYQKQQKEAQKKERIREARVRIIQEEQRKQKRTAWEQRRTMKTRVIDYSKLKSVRIDSKTHVFVEPGADIEKIKSLYNKPAYGTSKNKGVSV